MSKPVFTITGGAGSSLLTRVVQLNAAREEATQITAALGNQTAGATIAAGQTTGTISLSAAWYSEIPYNKKSAQMTLTAVSGEETYARTDSLAAPSAPPTGATLAAEPSSTEVPSEWNMYVAGHSKAHVTASGAAAQYGAQIANYKLTYMIGSAGHIVSTAGGIDHVTPILPGTTQFTLTVTDTRGNEATRQLTVTPEAYEPPTLSGIQSVRCEYDATTSEYVEADDGVMVLCSAQIACTSLDGNNSAYVDVAIRKQGASTWAAAGRLTSEGRGVFGGSLDLRYNYEIRYQITDAIGQSTVYTDLLTKAQFEMHIARGGGAWAFGGVADKPGALHVYGDIIADNFKTVDMHYFNVAANGTYTFHMANYTHVILFFLGYTHASRGIMLISCGSSGNITGSRLSQSSSPQLALSGSDGDVTLTSTYGSAIYCLSIAYHGTKPTYN